jgi:membrane associated rhomboid family serine protease
MISMQLLSRRAVFRPKIFTKISRNSFAQSQPKFTHSVINRRNFGSRNTLDGMNPDQVIYGILGLNIGVFFMWQTAETSEKRRFMVENFTTSYMHMTSGRLYTLLTAAFSHQSAIHFATNGLGLYFFGREVCHMLGPRRFLTFYVGSAGITSSK